MAAGFEAWTESGLKTFSTEDYNFMLIGSLTIGGNATYSGSISVSAFSLPGVTGVAFLQSMDMADPGQAAAKAPVITVSGNNINWSFPDISVGNAPVCRILYGIK